MIFEGDKVGISAEQFKQAMAEKGLGWNMGYIGRPGYAPPCIADHLGSEPYCEVAEYLMPRLVLTGTGGDPQGHIAAAEKLSEVIDSFG